MRGTRRVRVSYPPGRRSIPAHAGNTCSAPRPVSFWAVHPRACGEHLVSISPAEEDDGPSPRMRGTRQQWMYGHGKARSIPAHAGNTGTRRRGTSRVAVHPRACGEHLFRNTLASISVGPSPRMRGTLRAGVAVPDCQRSIPAHAGNTDSPDGTPRRGTVHPRACGEHGTRGLRKLVTDGPSPRMRGTPVQRGLMDLAGRSIPAHAGNTTSRPRQGSCGPVHPLACGEHSTRRPERSRPSGPSPRMRGTPGECDHAAPLGWSIPAHAGNTWSVRRADGLQPVHPRACGEHTRHTAVHRDGSGPSPRMRGTPDVPDHPARQARSIPAHAGNTGATSAPESSRAVHPRACGEHALRARDRWSKAGPSPRMRGTLIIATIVMLLARSIPAHAGNT